MSYLYQETTIGQLCRDGGGNVQTGPFGSQLKASAYVTDGIPTIMPADLIDFRVSDKEIARISTEDHKRLSRHQLRPGDIVYGRRGDIGRHALINQREAGWLCGTGCLRIRFGNAPIEPRYISYYLRQSFVIERILGMAVGSTMPNLNTSILESVPVLLPSLPIQRRIAEILGRLDDKIEVNRRINRTLEAMAGALYKHWFVDFGPFQDGEFVESALGLIPQGWTTTTLKEITTKIGSGATPLGGSSVYIDDGVYLIRSQNIYDSRFAWDGLARITDDAAAKLSNVTVAEGDVLINITGDSILRTCVTDRAMLPARVNQHVAIIRAASDIPPHFIHQHLLRSETKDMLLNMSSGATRKAVTKANLENTQILLPPTSILSAFCAKTDPFFAQISSGNRESRKLTEIRDYLLPKLLSGVIPVEAAGAMSAQA
ncbi:MAG: restriction endonuclease subunit S [Caldilineaceae bacterium]